jgi:nucleoside-diphosphate kinase
MKVEEDISVVLIKPDGVRKKVVGEIVNRFEKVGLKMIAAKLIWVSSTFAGKHYADDNSYHKSVGVKTFENYRKYGLDPKENLGTTAPVEIGRLVRKWNMEFISSGPVFAMLWQGPGAVEVIRKMAGFTFPFDAPPGTIRGDYALDSSFDANIQKRTAHNIIHASGSKKEAEFERKLWFKESEIYDY